MMWFCSEECYKSRAAVAAQYPAAAKITKVFSGWIVFEFYTDYLTWKKPEVTRRGCL